MNTPERNEKNIKKMQGAGKVYSESDEDKSSLKKEDLQKIALDNATREYPLATARKAAQVACMGLWLFSVAGTLFGVSLKAMSPFLFFALSATLFLNLPVFYAKKKRADLAMCLIAGITCMIIGISLLIGGK